MNLYKLKVRVIKDSVLILLKILPKNTSIYNKLVVVKSYYINVIDNIYYSKAYPFLKRFSSLNKNDLTKKSDTLFILGTGSSINDITENQFKEISKHDSIAFNHFLIHDFIPDYYLLESSRDSEVRNIQVHNIKQREKDYKGVKFLFKGLEFSRTQNVLAALAEEDLDIDFYYSTSLYSRNNLKTKKTTEKELLQILNFSKKINKNRISFCYEKRASLSHLLFWAYLQDYKKIVLCGIDLNNSKYFYESDKYKSMQKDLIIPPNGQKGVLHASNDRDANRNNLTIQEVIEVYDKLIFKPNKINVFVSSNSSALSKNFPTYSFDHPRKY